MPADAEELEMAMEDGVEFAELLSPVSFADGKLLCKKMKLGACDATGRREVVDAGEEVNLEADTVIAAVGEKVPGDFYKAAGIALDAKGRVQADAQTMATNLPNVYVVGDGSYGPSTVVESIASAYTPVPGGVGPMTINTLIRQTVDAAEKSAGLDNSAVS